jgi:sugar-specific transcriptional regulator TrmB
MVSNTTTMSSLDLTPFGFTPTESKVYQVLLTGGPGTGYAVARSAGLARANAYSALEGLVSKGAARGEDGQPKVYRAEPPAGVLARITAAQGDALDRLATALEGFGAPASPSIVELSSVRGLLQLLTHEIGRAKASVELLAPADAYPLLAPALRRAASAGLTLSLYAPVKVELPFVQVEAIGEVRDWPGAPLLAIMDGAGAVIAGRQDNTVRGHWGSAPTFVAAARLTLDRLRMAP